MRIKLLFITLFCALFFANAQTNKELANKYLNERGELVFTFTANNLKEAQELSNILSFDHGQDRNKPLTINAIANKKNFQKFLAFNLPFTVDKKSNEPKDVVMFDPKIHKKGISGKNAAYTLTFPLTAYPTYADYAQQMADFANDHPTIAQLIDIGGTVQGVGGGDKRLLFIKLSDNVTTREQEPRVMYTSSMHGDEIAGYPGMLNLIDYLITAYEDTGHADHTRVKNLLDNSEVWINPLANPDATYWLSNTNTSVANSRRENANNVDLNRNYPDNVVGNDPTWVSYEIETQNFMALAESTHFVLAANFHGGVELVNYPFDNAFASTTTYHSEDPSGVGPYYTHPDTDWFEYISVEYATQAQNDSDILGQTSYMTVDKDSYIYPSPGVTHGAEWYQVFGGRQDYMNYYNHTKELTVELSDVKTPPSTNTSSPDEIIDIWNYNKDAYINYLTQGTYGFQGVVKDAVTGNPIKAKITLVGHDAYGSWVETELPLGDYYRPVKAGTYNILYEADCYQSFTLTNQTITDYQTIVLPDVLLTPVTATVPTNLISSSITTTSATLGWDDAGVTSYDIRYRIVGSPTWTDILDIATTSYTINGLSASTNYEVQVRSKCNASTSAYTSSSTFTTLAVNYCANSGNNSDSTGITSVVFNSINNINNSKNGGYEDFSSFSTDVILGNNYNLTVNINTAGNYTVGVFVYIDFNKNGILDDAGESFDLGNITNVTDGTLPVKNIAIPNLALTGTTKMRIVAKWDGNGSPSACSTTTYFGEVEDYTVNIIDSTLGIEDEILNTFQLYPNPVSSGEITIKMPKEITDFTILISNVFGQKVYRKEVISNYNNLHKVTTTNLQSGIYFITVSTNLGKATKKLVIQ